jgi:hypothetical protein
VSPSLDGVSFTEREGRELDAQLAAIEAAKLDLSAVEHEYSLLLTAIR